MSARLLRAGTLPDAPPSGEAAGWLALTRAAGAAGKKAGAAGKANDAVTPPPDGGRAASRFEEELASVRQDLERARIEAESSVKASYQSGFDAGYREAEAQSRGEIDSFRKQISSALSAAEAARRDLIERTDADLARLSIAIAEKILNRQVQIDPEALTGLTRAALERLNGKTVQCVRIHPEDRAAVEEAIAPRPGSRAIRVEADASLARGALLFETSYGVLDASIATQLDEIERGLTDRLRRSAV